MRCVNKSSKEFKQLSQQNNISINTLELITHKYWIESGKEGPFPTSIYIQAQLGKTQYQEPSKTVRQLWEKSYKYPQTFSSTQDFNVAYEEAQKCFPKEALVHYKNSEGKNVLVVKTPVAKLKRNSRGLVPVLDLKGRELPAITKRDAEDYVLITRQEVPYSQRTNEFAIEMLRVLNDPTLFSENLSTAIETGKWKAADSNEIDTIVESIDKGEYNYNRFPQEAKEGWHKVGKIGQSAELLLRAFSQQGSQELQNPTPRERLKRDKAQQHSQEGVIENWAKAVGVWYDIESAVKDMQHYGNMGTSEAEVYRKDSTTIRKVLPIKQYVTPQFALDYITLQNMLSPEASLTVVGFGRNENGEFQIIVDQSLVEGTTPTEAEIDDFMGKQGFKKNSTPEGDVYITDSIQVSNLQKESVIKVSDGDLVIMDATIRLNTPDLNTNGKYVINEGIESNKSETDEVSFYIERPTSSERHSFTFNDGTTISTPFVPNKQQADALNVMSEFMKSNEATMTLSGYAGTGKTSLMEIIARKASREFTSIQFCATTNKAAAVLDARVRRVGFRATTLNKIFGISVEVDSTKSYDARNLVNVLAEPKVEYGSVVIIDEASMINEANYNTLNDIARKHGLKIIYVGDKGQLAPVNETLVSKVFRNNEGTIVELTQVERTGDNAILKEATNRRNGIDFSGESSFNNRGEGVAYLNPTNSRKEIGEVISHFIERIRRNLNSFKILAYTNAKVSEYNDYVRSLLGYEGAIPLVGESLMGYSNWGRRRDGSYRFVNSESYRVTRVGRPQTAELSIDGNSYKMQYVPITMENSLGEIDTFNYMDVKDNKENRKVAMMLSRLKAALWEKYRNTSVGKVKRNILSEISGIDSFLFVNDDLSDENGSILQKKVIDFGYALTIHKSQGSTFTHVLIDDVNIDNSAKSGEVIELLPLKQEETNNSANSIDLRQQLEYVAISRAAKTATIIAKGDMIKNEDSPLNHITDTTAEKKKDNAPKIEDTRKPVQRMGSKELWEHLESLVEPMGERPIYYTPKGKQRQQYIVKDGKVYNKEGKEVHYQGKDMNRILANLAIAEDRGVVVEYKGRSYVVDNHQTITSVTTGDIMKWGPENGDRKAIIQQAEQAFRTLIDNRQHRLSTMVPEIMNLLRSQGITLHDKADMEKFLKENPQWTSKIQQAIEENHEMQEIKAKAIADGTFMKAPNGKPTNLTERQWLQVRTRNFKNWFGDWEKFSIFANEFNKIDNERENAEGLSLQRMDLAISSGIERELKEAISVFERGKNSSGQGNEGNSRETNEQKQRRLEKWAKDNNLWVDNLSDVLVDNFGAPIEGGGEAVVYDAGDSVVKSISLDYYDGDPQLALDRILLHNYLFKDTQLTDIGFGRDSDGTFKIIISQPYVKGVSATREEILQYTRKRGFKTTDGNTFYFNGIKINDLNSLNVIKSPDGIFRVIDAELRLMTQDEYNTLSKNTSKAVDENGEPLVVYHGSPSEFTQFDKDLLGSNTGANSAKLGFFFSKTYGASRSYIGDVGIGEDNLGYYSVIPELEQLQNEIYSELDILDNEYQYNMISKKEYDSSKAKLHQTLKDKTNKIYEKVRNNNKKVKSYFLNIRNIASYTETTSNNITQKVTDAISKKADGVLLLEVKDPTTTDDYIVFEPNQIKSATDNNGEFSTENDDIQALQTSEGEIYGFADKKGELYFDETVVSPNVQIHEYTHLWDRAVAERNSELWKRGIELMKQTFLWEEVLNDTNYGKKWQAMEKMSPEKLESLIASEVHSRLVGTQGEALLNRIAKEKGSEGIVAKLKQWILDFWKELKGTFSNWSDEEINNLTLDDFNKMTVRDLIDKVNLKEEQNSQQPAQQQSININTISNKSAAYGVEIISGGSTALKRNYAAWQQQHPEGIVAYRVNFNKYATPEEANAGRIGNPFSENTRGKDTVQQFYEWLTTGNNFGNIKATEEYREAIIQRILNTPENAAILYYTELNRPSHATVIGYLVANKQLLKQNSQQQSTITQQGILPPVEDVIEQPQTISLPNYDYSTDKSINTVDAAWKVPLLQQLDEQLGVVMEEIYKSADPDSNAQNEILAKMDRIINAESKESLLNLQDDETAQTKQKKEVTVALEEHERIIQQINNLLDSNIISASEIRHVAELVVNSISDIITDLQTKEGEAEKLFPSVKTKIDFKKATRKEIVEAIGVNNLIYEAKKHFDPEFNNYTDIDTIDQADLIVNNWDAIITLAADVFAFNEGFGITKNYTNSGFTTTQSSTTIDQNNFNDYSNDPDVVAETEKDEQEHWQVDQKTVDVMNSMSQLVRMAIHNCYQKDKDGNNVVSKWGITERVNPRKAVNSILRWVQGSLSLTDMIKRMSEKAPQNPWVNQLIERLSDDSGNETDFQSQFYGVFSKHFQLYSIVLKEDGKYHCMTVNDHPALSEAMQSITTEYKIGQHPLFTTNGGVNGKLLGSKDTTYAEAPFNLHKALANLLVLQDEFNHGEELNEKRANVATENLLGATRILGYNVTEEMLSEIVSEENIRKMSNALLAIVRSLDSAKQAYERDKKSYNPFAFGKDNNISSSLKNFLMPITDTLEDSAITAFYDSGKMYQSYITPSFLTKLMKKFNLEGEEFEEFIMKEYGNTELFKSKVNQWDVKKGWRNEWLRLLATNESARKVFAHKVELNFNKHNYMRNMNDAEYNLSLLAEYFSEVEQKKEALVPAWFRIPIMSNKPSSEFIRFYSYRGSNYKEEIVRGLQQMFLQELSRIQTVLMRNRSKGDPDSIKSFDENGRKFQFLPFLNSYLTNNPNTLIAQRASALGETVEAESDKEFAELLKRKVSGKKESALTADEEAKLMKLASRAIRQATQNRVDEILANWEKEGILEAAKNVEGIGTKDSEVRANIENFLWNDNFAAKNILQLTITDMAFYKDAEELQKRLAQLHAPGIRARVDAVDYNGVRVSADGKYRTILINDYTFKTDLIANIREVFDRKIANAPEGQKPQLEALKETLVGENGRYTKIEVTDGQGYSSPTSYRKKAFMFGRWSRQAEEIYQKLKSGKYTYTDLEVAFQPLKPFVYTHTQKSMGVSNAPITSMPVPFQVKNSEYLLIMADAILQGEETSRPNLLRAIYRVMEDSAYDGRTYKKDAQGNYIRDKKGNLIVENEGTYNGKGIDTVNFGSAVKSGLQSPIDINAFLNLPNGEDAAYDTIRRAIYKKDAQGNLTSEYESDSYVHTGMFEDYCLQQEVPEHFLNHSQAHGSQVRMIVPSDLSLYKNPNGDHEDVNNQVFYEWTEPDGTVKRLRADEFHKEYENTIAKNIEQSIEELSTELHLDSRSKKEKNIVLSKILIREILSSPRYGVDLAQACSIDKETGEFRIPLGDPIQSKRIEQLINSVIKNRINKQKIAGGPVVQVTNFGTSKRLRIRFKNRNKDGELLMTEEEFNNTPSTGYTSYEEYTRENQGGIAYFEVFAPIWSKEIFKKFANEDGTINVEALKAIDPDLLKMISYRIPTEEKYSIAPMMVVGFMPREAGAALMLPWELTEIDDSDFDVDKRYIMRKDLRITKKSKEEIREALFDAVNEHYDVADLPVNYPNLIDAFLESPNKERYKNSFNKWLYSQYHRVAYKTIHPTSGKTYRDNKIIDMNWAVLTNEMTADKILNPGGFETLKRVGYLVTAYKHPSNTLSWEELKKLSTDELHDRSYTEKDLTWADTQVQFYKQNAAAASLVGVFAVNKVAHATYESNDYFIDIKKICGNSSFTIGRTEFTGRMKVDPTYDRNGNLVGKNIGEGVPASTDAAKTPVLNLMNINMSTAGLFNTMLRLGMVPEEAALFMSQEIIERVLDQFNRENLAGNFKTLNAVIEEHLDDLKDKYGIDVNSAINSEPISEQELIDGLLPLTAENEKRHEVIEYKVLTALKKLKEIDVAIKKMSFPTRLNSISSAVGPLIIDNLILEHKMNQFNAPSSDNSAYFYDTADEYDPNGHVVDINTVFNDHPILAQFSRAASIARSVFSNMPANSYGFRNMLDRADSKLMDKIYNDKKLFSSLSDFYQSYLLIASNLIDPNELKYYIEDFPKEFNKNDYKKKYSDNKLIQDITPKVEKRSGRVHLTIQITGLDETQKELYHSAWIDLHKNDPELSKKLFTYCFFRGGIGFTPKTFMSLVPVYVKERIATDLENGEKVSYVDTFRKLPSTVPDIVFDQWVCNNYNDNKLVPWKGKKRKGTDGKETESPKYIIDIWKENGEEFGSLVAKTQKDIADLKDCKYIKTRSNNQTYVWKQTYAGSDAVNYTMLKLLGNNNEYLEMSLEEYKNPMTKTIDTVEDIKEAEIDTKSPIEDIADEVATEDLVPDSEKTEGIIELSSLIMQQNPKLNRTDALNKIEDIKKNINKYAKFLQNVFKHKGLELSEEKAIEEFKKLC